MNHKQIFLFFTLSFGLSCANRFKTTKLKNVQFNKVVLSTEFISEGVAVDDVNKDGKMDVLAGTFWWRIPEWTRQEITNPYIHPSFEGYSTSFLNFTMDVNQDNWDDMKNRAPGQRSFMVRKSEETGRPLEREIGLSFGR